VRQFSLGKFWFKMPGERLSAKKWGRSHLLWFLLTALSDDAQAVVVEVSEAVGAALDEFHFSVEALRDAVVSGKAPHGDQRLSPTVKRGGQAYKRLKAGVSQFVDEAQELHDVAAAGFGRFVFKP
jgi:hypothetical protein